jgi:hypothetical protein
VADIETSVAITAQTDGLQAGLSSAADAVESATAAMRAQFADLGTAAQQAQAQIATAAAQIASAMTTLQGQTANLAASGGGTGRSNIPTGSDNQYPGLSVTEAAGSGDITQLEDIRSSQSAIDQDYYARKAAAAQDDAQTQQTLLDQQEIAYQNYLNDKDTLDARAAQNGGTKGQGMLQPIQRALDTSITGLVTGTTSVPRALSNVSQSIVGEFVKSAVGSVFGGVGDLLGPALASGGGGDQDFSGGVAGAAEGVLGGGLFNSLFRGIGALFSFERGGIVPSAQGGWMVPSTSLAMLHTNEMVLPANISQGLQSMIANGGGSAAPNVTFAVSAMDSQSVAAFFKNNGATLVSAINNAMRNGSALRSM